MEKKNLVKLACAALLVPTLASCNEELEVVAENSKDAEKRETMQAVLDEYTSNFESRYGTIDPTHDWGMTMSATSDVTRATVDNRNEWVSKYHLEVPGWPDDYYKSDGTPASNGYHYLNSAGTNASYSDNPPAGSHPAGDVTDEEIQYVSWWFRTHKYPTSVKLHWTDFYVQGISADNDRDAEGKRIDILERYKQNSEGSFFFDELSSDHTTYTIDYFSAAVMQPDPEQYPDGWDHIKNYNRGNSNVLDGEDNLYVGTSESNAYALTADYKNNLSNSNLTNRLIAFYQSSGTENFRAHYSQNNADLDWNVEYNNDGSVNTTPGHEGHQSWVLVYLHFTGPSGRVYEGYYLGFDYQVFKEEDGTVGENNLTKYTLHKADGYYSNWIFKLSPALPHVHNEDYTGLSRRIMCEDLGNTYDFDFNDVVFDATYNITKEEYNAYLSGEKNESPIDVTITLQAAGGTMPIYVGESPKPTFEAHFLLGGYPSSTPINVGGASSTVSIYHYKLDFPQDANSLEARKQALSLNNIPIYVQSQDKKGVYLLNSNTPWATPDYKDNGHHTPSNAGTDLAPRAFGVPIGVCWMNECKFIETSYPHFADWVGNMESYGEDSEYPWYMTDVTNTGDIHVYSPYVKPAESGNSQ